MKSLSEAAEKRWHPYWQPSRFVPIPEIEELALRDKVEFFRGRYYDLHEQIEELKSLRKSAGEAWKRAESELGKYLDSTPTGGTGKQKEQAIL